MEHNSECHEINYHLRLSISFDEFPPEDNYPKIKHGKEDSVRFYTIDEKSKMSDEIVLDGKNDHPTPSESKSSHDFLKDADDAPTESASKGSV